MSESKIRMPDLEKALRERLDIFCYKAPFLKDVAIGLGACVILGLRYAETAEIAMGL